ncbi:uncharacterized protein LOC100205549 isoform X1 [Hydra vulgaris]|uniref:uncharacterized protein LOC100205549 isoform X1 n=1 Tax=Hydra vulgaris TaxID=6087 RepID=UPI001F5FD4DF|nr:uncharacterized protein LOC100205549 [Hydra vulgaris]XP_047130301.1 uncharacterized protein LOC100205549 [Hydra vulgaris]
MSNMTTNAKRTLFYLYSFQFFLFLTLFVAYIALYKYIIPADNRFQIIKVIDSYVLPQCRQPSYSELTQACGNTMFWENRIFNPDLLTNLSLSTFKLDVKPDFVVLTIHTVDNLGRTRKNGGDFWWVRVVEPVFFLVPIIDFLNGTYQGVFTLHENGIYKLEILLEFSNCEGAYDPPRYWFKRGTYQGLSQQRDWLQPSAFSEILETKVMHFETFQTHTLHDIQKSKRLVNLFPCVINADCGMWFNGSFISQNGKNSSPTFLPMRKRNGTLWIYGDSLGKRLHDYVKIKPLCQELFLTCNYTYNWVYPLKENSHGFKEDWVFDDQDFNQTLHLNFIKNVIMNSYMRKKESVLLINFGLHLVKSLPMSKLKNLFNEFIIMLKELNTDPLKFPIVIWKTTTPPYQSHEPSKNFRVMRFLTKQRVAEWNAYTKEKLCLQNIPVLDVYGMAGSFPKGPIDSVHFPDEAFDSAIMYLENYLEKL